MIPRSGTDWEGWLSNLGRAWNDLTVCVGAGESSDSDRHAIDLQQVQVDVDGASAELDVEVAGGATLAREVHRIGRIVE